MYGRARRLDLVKKISIGIIVVVLVYIVGSIIISWIPEKYVIDEYAMLRRYMTDRGFKCETLKTSGGACKYSNGDVKERFIRYEKGFEYIYNNKKYIIDIYHVDGVEKITFSTGDDAFSGYKNLDYVCSYKDNIVNKIDGCVLKEDEKIKLDNDAYIGLINKTLGEVNKMLNASGYKVNDLLDKYEWNKK